MSSRASTACANSGAILPALIVWFSWPLILLTRISSTFATTYYSFVSWFTNYFVGEPITDVKQELLNSIEVLLADSAKDLQILEIVPCEGSSYPHYPEGTKITTIEVNPLLKNQIPKLRKKFKRIKSYTSLTNNGRNLKKIPDNSMDAVVSTHVLCCMDDPEATLKEIHRVLVPGGRFFFLELIRYTEREPFWKRALQSFHTPIWKAFALGCKAGDQCVDTLLERAGFYSINGQSVELPELPITHSLVYFGSAYKSNNMLYLLKMNLF